MSSIYNFHEVSDMLACSGQPREGQLSSVAANEYKVVINLGLLDGQYALADEAASVKSLGMVYHHIPVVFDDPQRAELSLFIEKMNEHTAEKTLVHCAANYRASVFTGLYLFAAAKFGEAETIAFIENI
ncbi:MAG: protein tyrosine phosphatase family protein, partial [Mucilaginibacter sp.]